MAELSNDKVVKEGPRVSMSLGFKKNLGNYETLSFDLGLSASGLPGESPDAVFDRVSDWLSEKFTETFKEFLDEVDAEKSKRGS